VGLTHSEERILRSELDAAFEEALRPLRAPGGALGILFSGGVDSSLLAFELRSRPELTLCTMGRDGAPDLKAGQEGATRLGLPWEPNVIGELEVAAAESRFASELVGLPPVSRTVLLGLAVAITGARPSRLVCGQGADELFLGYAHYRGLSADEASMRAQEDLDRLLATDWPRTLRIGEKAGKTLFAPYLSATFVRAARAVPTDSRIPREMPKRYFREWALARGLPAELALRPKKALQYGTGVAALVRARSRP